MIRVEIPMALPSAGNLHEHWRHRHKRIKAQRAATALALRRIDLKASPIASGLTGGGRALAIALTRVSPRKLDDDNLAFAFKGIRDEVAAYFGVDDADPRIEWVYRQAKGATAVRIEFEVVAAAPPWPPQFAQERRTTPKPRRGSQAMPKPNVARLRRST